jgi:hypothetical protein
MQVPIDKLVVEKSEAALWLRLRAIVCQRFVER